MSMLIAFGKIRIHSKAQLTMRMIYDAAAVEHRFGRLNRLPLESSG